MGRRWVFVIAAAWLLSGCCLQGGCYVPPPNLALANWDGFEPVPKHHPVKQAKIRTTSVPVLSEDKSPSEEDLSKLRPYSKEWGVVLDAINSAADAKLKKKLIICRNCLPEADDQTGSIIRPGGYLSLRQ
jgi:hypothetical protein